MGVNVAGAKGEVRVSKFETETSEVCKSESSDIMDAILNAQQTLSKLARGRSSSPQQCYTDRHMNHSNCKRKENRADGGGCTWMVHTDQCSGSCTCLPCNIPLCRPR